MNVEYPKKGERVEAKRLENAVVALQKQAANCLAQADAAKEAFANRASASRQEAVAGFVAVARALARSQGEPSAASSAELSGPAWARMDEKFGLGLGLADQARLQSLDKEKMVSEHAEMSAGAALRIEERRVLHGALILARNVVAARKKSAKDSKNQFDPHIDAWREVYESQGLASSEQAREAYAEESSLGELFGTDYAKRRKSWSDLLASGIDLPNLKSFADADDDKLKRARAEESALAARVDAEAKRSERYAFLDKEIAKPRQWIDESGAIASGEVYGRLGGSVKAEAALVAMAKALPSSRAEARAAMRVVLAEETLGLGAQSIEKEMVGLKKLKEDCSVLGRRMSMASKDNPMAKVAAGFDFAPLAERLLAREKVFRDLKANGPRKTVEKIEAMDWTDRPELSLERIEELEKRAVEKFGPTSEAAKTLALEKKIVASGGNSSGMGAWYWSDVLGGAADNYMAMEAVEGLAELAFSGARAVASSSATASAGFDLGWIVEGISWGDGAASGAVSSVADAASGSGFADAASGLADVAGSFDFGEALSAGADVLGDLASGLGDLASGLGDLF